MDSPRQCVVSLVQLQFPADAAVPETFQNGGHVRMKKRFSFTPAGKGQGESYQVCVTVGAEHLAAGFGRDDEERNRHDIKIRGFPDFAFDAHAGCKFRNSVAWTDLDLIGCFWREQLRSRQT